SASSSRRPTSRSGSRPERPAGTVPTGSGRRGRLSQGDSPRRSWRTWPPGTYGRAMTTCSELSIALGEPLHATAPYAPVWLLVEVASAWARKAVREAGLGELEQRAKEHGVRVGLIRRYGRRRTSETPRTVLVARCAEPSLERLELTDADLQELDPAGLPRGEPVPRPLYL